jgi:hypothetical protein
LYISIKSECRGGRSPLLSRGSAHRAEGHLVLDRRQRVRGGEPGVLPVVARVRVEHDRDDELLRLAGLDGAEVGGRRQLHHGGERHDDLAVRARDAELDLVQVLGQHAADVRRRVRGERLAEGQRGGRRVLGGRDLEDLRLALAGQQLVEDQRVGGRGAQLADADADVDLLAVAEERTGADGVAGEQPGDERADAEDTEGHEGGQTALVARRTVGLVRGQGGAGHGVPILRLAPYRCECAIQVGFFFVSQRSTRAIISKNVHFVNSNFYLTHLCYYKVTMNKSLSRIITGLIIIGVGLGALLDTLNIFEFWQFAGMWWPVSLVVVGLLILLSDVRQFIWSIALVVLGVLLQLRNLDILEFNVWSLVWPVAIIAVGLGILINRTAQSHAVRVQDSDDISAILGGSKTVNKSQDYKGGKATCVLGGVSIDLRDAKIKKEATLNVFVLSGGVELKIPREWRVQSNVFPILGGIENRANDDAKANAPVLIITGTVALGGVDIRS